MALLTGACGSGPTDTGQDPAGLRISPDSVAIGRLGTARLTVAVVGSGGAPLPGYHFEFSSSDQTLATVSDDGVITSVGPEGRAEVTVRAAGFAEVVPVGITALPDSVEITPTTAAIAQGDSLQLAVRVFDGAGDEIRGSTLTYSVDHALLASVTPAGLVRSLGPAGVTRIQITAGSVTRVLPLTILRKPTSFSITYTALGSVPPGGAKQLGTLLLDASGAAMAHGGIEWETSGVPAAVSSLGLFTAGGTPGRVSVRATYRDTRFGEFTAAANLYVHQPATPSAVVPSDLTTLTTGGTPWDVAIAPTDAIIAADLSGRVLRADLASFNAFSVVATGAQPMAIAMNATGTRAYVSGMEPEPGQGWGVGVVAVANGARVGYLHDGGFATPHAVALSRDGQRAVMGTSTGALVIFDVATGILRKTLIVDGQVGHIVAHPSAPLMYASTFGPFASASLVEIDLTTETTRLLSIGGTHIWKPQGLAISPDGTELFAADEMGPMQVWDLTSDRSAGLIPAAGYGFGLTQSPDGWTLYQSGGRVLAIDVASHVVTHHYEVPGARRSAVAPDGTTLVVASADGFLQRFSR